MNFWYPDDFAQPLLKQESCSSSGTTGGRHDLANQKSIPRGHY